MIDVPGLGVVDVPGSANELARHIAEVGKRADHVRINLDSAERAAERLKKALRDASEAGVETDILVSLVGDVTWVHEALATETRA